MKVIEIRRHSIRSKPGLHLNQSGVTLARLVGQNLGPFDRVITSTLSRAFETAIAMGFAVDEQIEAMSAYGDDVEAEVPWPQTFAVYAAAASRNSAAGKYAKNLTEFYENLSSYIAEGRAALVINHGGVLELGVVACLPDGDHESWGGAVDYCEGIRTFWENRKCVKAEVLRISK